MADREQFGDPAEINHRIGTAGTFSLQTVAGSVTLRGTETDEARVVARSESGRAETLPLIARRSKGGLHIETERKSFEIFGRSLLGNSDGIDFEITLPRGARVEINVVSADVEAGSLTGEQSYKSVSGDVEIAHGGGRISLTTVSGDVELSADGPLEASLTTTSGGLEISAALLTALQVRTVSGDVDVRGEFAAGPVHTVESVSGDLSLEPASGLTVDVKRGLDMATGGGRRLVAGDGSARLRFRSLSGDVELRGKRAESHAPSDATMRAVPPETRADPADSLEVLRALERGEIDVEEAARRLEGAASHG